MTPAARQIVFINTAHTITHYSLLILPTAVLAMAVPGGLFGESYGPILALATGMFVLYGLLSLPQGWLVQRFGRKALMTAFFLGTGSSLIAAGLAHSPAALAVTLACAGGFAAIYHPIGTTMLVEAAGDKPGRSIGINGVFGNLGVALAPVVTAFLANAGGMARCLHCPWAALRRRRVGVDTHAPRAAPAHTSTGAPSRRSRNVWSGARCSC